VAAEQRKRGLVASPAADPAVLLRRVYLDLIGLPPTREELQQFLADPSHAAYERVVDRLLASPHYGARWGRHWMDVWRYSDWYGSRAINEIRYSQRHIWRWRDWIVESLNADKGYDRMVLEMLAGDELAPADPSVARATGFIGRNWYKFDRNVWMFDAVEHTAQAFLGLTLKCARCHEHKYDPISQQDYYRFRAFFEPHDVRTDPLSGSVGTTKDATLGPVLADGVARVYDKQLDIPTYVFTRGDNRYPDAKQLCKPGVPAVFGLGDVTIQPVPLPAESFAPWLRDSIVADKIAAAQAAELAAQQSLADAKNAVLDAQRRLAAFIDRETSGQAPEARTAGSAFAEQFTRPRPEVWRAVGGRWEYERGRLVQKQPGTFPTLVANLQHPPDFTARVRYTTTDTGSIHSVGFFFDVVDLRDCQAVYTATNHTTSSVQAFHRQANVEHYPAAGIVRYSIRLNEPVTVDLAVRGQQLNVWVNGDLAIVYTMPMRRQTGTFAIWTHEGTAEFHELLIDPLPAEFRLAAGVAEQPRTPYAVPNRDEFEWALKLAQRRLLAAEQRLRVAAAEQAALQARLAADRAKVQEAANADESAERAGSAERRAKLAAAELDLQLATHAAFALRRQPAAIGSPPDPGHPKAVAEAAAKVAAAQKSLDTARAEADKRDKSYSPIGPIYPKTSTGRRLALARWITDPRNPRTARVAVNYVWLHHFGQALVPSVANFGLNGNPPSHPELLDWLAAELVEHDWQMKHLHRLIVLSNTYRQSAATAPSSDIRLTARPTPPAALVDAIRKNQSIDAENRYLWRMNSRRLESELVRDGVLSVAGQLEATWGGPEIDESRGQDSRRRSLYFRSTPNEKMPLLDVFDQANPNECYRRQESVVPQQSLALSNSALALNHARSLAGQLSAECGPEDSPPRVAAFIRAAFEQVLSRPPTTGEVVSCKRFLQRHAQLLRGGAKTPYSPAAGASVQPPSSDPHLHARENLIHVLLNHNDFVTVR
jgi:hypothetical protein